MLTTNEIREKYLTFFESKGCARRPSDVLVPRWDPSVLFTPAGMNQFKDHFLGRCKLDFTRATTCQKCLRTGDIDNVGRTAFHHTFFEMLGNFSFGDYFKREAIHWAWEFLTDKKWLAIDPAMLSATVYKDDAEAAKIWLDEIKLPPEKLQYLDEDENFWPSSAPSEGPDGVCGPCSEIYHKTPQGEVEIWNLVFTQFNRVGNPPNNLRPLPSKNIDTGMGLERTVSVLNGFDSVYEIDVFSPVIAKIEEISGRKYGESEEITKAMRIIADHIRTAVFMLGDQVGITPSNVDQGYVLRRIIRRAVRYMNNIGLKTEDMLAIAEMYIGIYKNVYTELEANHGKVIEELRIENEKFLKTLVQGEKEFRRVAAALTAGETINGETAFRLYDTYGFPIEMTTEYAAEAGLKVDGEGFKAKFAEHQVKSHAGSEQKFKGGLADHSDETAKLHTATHLLQAALRRVLGDEVKQKGSNITAERLRFDFSFHRPMTKEEIEETQRLVNEAIDRKLEVVCEEVPVEEARRRGAIGLFGDKYGEMVKLYTMGDFSMEICGGPHAKNTGDLGEFVITKEQSSSSGVRRIKAELKPRA